jgi:transposase
MGMKVLFIPPYTPEFAPVELVFAKLKMLLRRKVKERALKINKDEGINQITQIMNQIAKPEIIRCWQNLISKIHNLILIKN